MIDESPGEITMLLRAAKAGDPTALDRLFLLVYDELRKIARNQVHGNGHWTSEPTTLVHEAYLRLFKTDRASWEDRHHFFWAAARAMHDILVERARREGAVKRGGGRTRCEIRDDLIATAEVPDLLDLHDALKRMERVHPKSYEIVMLRFFAGLSRDQIAETLNLSESAVYREWEFARAWLFGQLHDNDRTSDRSPENKPAP